MILLIVQYRYGIALLKGLFGLYYLSPWHALLFLGIRFFPPFFFILLGGLHCFFL
jgi:hypothetical protein